MPQRGIDTAVWSHAEFSRLSAQAKLLFLYCCTSMRGNSAGMYRITRAQIAFDTALPESKVDTLFSEIEGMNVVWYPEREVVWVQHFLQHQTHSEKYLIAVGRALEHDFSHSNTDLVQAFLKLNDRLSIPYSYGIDNLTYPDPYTYPDNSPDSDTELSGSEKALTELKGWDTFTPDDRKWLDGLQADEGELKVADIHACQDHWMAKTSPHNKGTWKKRLRNWLINKRRFAGDANGNRGLPGNKPAGAFDDIAG